MVPSWLVPAGFTILPHIGAFVNAAIMKDDFEWYDNLKFPPGRPPNWVFGPVWTTLYTGAGYASYLVYRDSTGPTRKLALTVYAANIGLNWLWSPIFFRARKMGLATIEMWLMWGSIIATIWQFYPINKNAAYLLLPYLGWVSYAGIFTYKVWKINKKSN